MLSEKKITEISKFLSLILRHKPETIGILVDQNGWTDVDELIVRSNKYGIQIDKNILFHIVANNSKKRFALNDALDKIRASQGHSFDIELGYKNQRPPQFLFHGTGEKSVLSILETGLEKRNRQHVHLSSNMETAFIVGKRHGKPFIFKVLAALMYEHKFEFLISDNGVWLTDHVPAKYLKQNFDQ